MMESLRFYDIYILWSFIKFWDEGWYYVVKVIKGIYIVYVVRVGIVCYFLNFYIFFWVLFNFDGKNFGF